MKDHNFTSLTCLQPYNSAYSGFDGFQSSNSELSMMMGSNNNISNGYLGTGIVDNNYQEQLSDGSIDISSQFPYFSPVKYSSMSTAIDNFGLATPPLVDYHCSLLYDSSINTSSHSLFVQPPHEPTMKDVGKFGYETSRLGQRNSKYSNIRSLEASRMTKKRKAIEQLIDSQQLEKPGRKSQKLSDKINALQEIVCPYGKTDTASVLQEACIYIRIIHQELRRLSISYFETRSLQSSLQVDVDHERQADLLSKGLCLVPTSIMKSLTRENCSDQHEATIAPRSFIRRPRYI